MIVLVTKGTNHEAPIQEYIRRFGKYIVKDGLVKGVYKVKIPPIKRLLEYGFKKRALPKVVFHLKRGKHMHHLVKETGQVKKNFYGKDIMDDIDNCPVIQSFQCKMSLHDLSHIMFEKYKHIYAKQFKGLDLKIDPITCNDICDPCYILPDWKMGNKVILDVSTIHELSYKEKEYTGFTTDENGRDTYYYRWVYDDKYFVSPYTRKLFTWDDVVFVKSEYF